MKNTSIRYQEIADYIEEKVNNGTYVSGYIIPSEAELANEFGVSRMTARNATSLLVNKGILYRVNGRGTIVSSNRIRKNDFFMGFTGTEQAISQSISAKIIDFTVIEADDLLASKLQIKKRAPVYFIKRVRSKHDYPFLLENMYCSKEAYENLDHYDLAANSFYQTIKTVYNTQIKYTNQEITSTLVSNNEISDLLFNGKKGVVVVVTNHAFNDKDVPVEYSVANYNASYFVGRYRLSSDNGYIEIINP